MASVDQHEYGLSQLHGRQIMHVFLQPSKQQFLAYYQLYQANMRLTSASFVICSFDFHIC